METTPLRVEPHALPARAVSGQERPEIKAQDISTRLTIPCETADEEFELIEMRYQHALALMSLEDLFAEGQLEYL